MNAGKLNRIKYFVGIDLSKLTFNYCIRYDGTNVTNGKSANNPESIVEFLDSLHQITGFNFRIAVFGMEVTGIYGNILINALMARKAKFVVAPAIRIKNSLGIIRGKNDNLDAARIARYLIKNLSELELWTPRRKLIDQLASLSSLRERMVKIKKIVKTPIDEDQGFVSPAIAQSNIEFCEPLVFQINTLVDQTDDKIKQLWTNDERCKRLMEIMLSVTGIGPVTAIQILIHTNEFKSIKDARSFASYCGVAPFEHQSGTSVKKKSRVSPFANRRIKSLLHNGVRACIAYDHEIKAYYQRKVLEDKKNKMSVMNAIKFKLICRIFACVKTDRLYNRAMLVNNTEAETSMTSIDKSHH